MDIMARKLGAVPVRMAAPDVYESLSRGTLDGLIFPTASIVAYDLTGLVRQSTTGENFGSFASSYSISKAKWDRLPEAARKALRQAGDEIVSYSCKLIDEDERKMQQKLRDAGVKMVELTVAEKAKLGRLLKSVADEWAADLDRRGKPGTEVLNAYRAALAQ